MGKSREDKLRVYLACRDMFANTRVGIKGQEFRNLFRHHQHEILSRAEGLEINRIANIVHNLLNAGVFKDLSRAKKVIPDLDMKKISESDNSSSKTCSCKVPKKVPTKSSSSKTPSGSDHAIKGVQPTTPTTAIQSKDGKLVHEDCQYLPISSQHLILNKVQQLAEESCFDHALKWLPELLTDHGWYAPEAVELTAWPKALLMYNYPATATHLPDKATIMNKLEDLRPLRNAAVHRLQKPAEEVHRLIESAIELVTELQDPERVAVLEQLQDYLSDLTESLEIGRVNLKKDMNLKVKLINKEKAEVARQLASQLADLDQKSALAGKEMIEADQKLRYGLDLKFKELYGQMFGTNASASLMRPDYVTTQSCQQQSEEEHQPSDSLIDHNTNDYKGKGVNRLEDNKAATSSSTLRRKIETTMDDPEVVERVALPLGLISNVSRGSWKLIANILA